MKMHKKLEVGLLGIGVLITFILQFYIKSNLKIVEDTISTGIVETASHSLQPFNTISTQCEANITYKKGEPKIEIKTDKAYFDLFQYNQEGEHLELTFEGQDIDQEIHITIYNNAPLNEIEVGGVDIFHYEHTDTIDNVSIKIKNASQFYGSMVGKTLQFKSNDASRTNLSGSFDTAEIKLRNASRANMKELTIGDATITLNDASSLSANTTQSISISGYNASKAIITGGPKVNTLIQKDASRIEFE